MKKFKKPSFDIASILQLHKHRFSEIQLNTWQQRTLFALARCRTKEMGGHIDKCDHQKCNALHISYNSCRNRHCPKCQGHLREEWIHKREEELLNTSYFHVVFTIPHELNTIALSQAHILYKVLFKTAWQTMKGFGDNPKFLGAKTGMIALLHTWGQNLSLHPHLHCIVPAGGITQTGKWKKSLSKGKFLFPVKKMSTVFRAKFIHNLKQEGVELETSLTDTLFSKPWVIYAKKPFYGPNQVIEYLGRYSHKIAISNHRIREIKGSQSVTFELKNYKKSGNKELLTISQDEFIRRFALHILPKGFTKIRHYGILSSSSKNKYRKLINKELGEVKFTKEREKSKHRTCPTCGKGKLVTLMTFDQRGPPAQWQNLFS